MIFATRAGVQASGVEAAPITSPPAPTTWAHWQACAWTAAWLTARGRHVVGDRELLLDEGWEGELEWLERGGWRRRGHRPDLAAALTAGGPLLPIEVELAGKSTVRLRTILALHASWVAAGKTPAVIYVCGTSRRAASVIRHADQVGLSADAHILDSNPAQGIRVRPNDPRLSPRREQRQRRAVPADEVGAFITAVPRRYRAVCWTPFLTGVRPGELFGLSRRDLDRDAAMIYVHQTVSRYGRLEPGLKTTHHVRDRERRGRWTLFPACLLAMLEKSATNIDGRLYPSPRGKLWSQRNFYRDIWEPAQEAAGTGFTLYDARHTFSSRLLAAGIPLVEVAAWMGHSLRAGGEQMNTTTRKYAHATGELTARALRELESFVATAEQAGTRTVEA